MKNDAPVPRWEHLSLGGLFLLSALLLLPLPGLPLGDDFAFLEALRSDHGWHFVLTSQGPGGNMRFWRPLSFGALLLEDRLLGLPWVPTVSLGLHLALGWLTWRAVRTLGSSLQALLAAGMVLLHPRGVEAVGWASAQADLGMALCVGLGGLELLSATPRRPRLLLLQLLALGFKETGVVLTLWGLARSLWHQGSRTHRADGLSLLALSLGWFALRGLILGQAVGGYRPELHAGGGILAGLLGPPLSAALAWCVPIHLGGDFLTTLWTLPPLALGMGLASSFVLLALIATGASTLGTRPAPVLLQPATLAPLGGLYALCMLPAFGLLTGLDGSADRYLTLPALVLAPLSVALLGMLERGARHGLERVLAEASAERWNRVGNLAGMGLLLGLALLMHARVSTFTEAARTGERYLEGLEQNLRGLPEPASGVVLVGVPDRLQGVGVFSAGLGAALRSRGLPLEGLQVWCWLEQVDDAPGQISWKISILATDSGQVRLEAHTTGGWKLRAGSKQLPGAPDPARHTRPDRAGLALDVPAGVPILAFDGLRVATLSVP